MHIQRIEAYVREVAEADRFQAPGRYTADFADICKMSIADIPATNPRAKARQSYGATGTPG